MSSSIQATFRLLRTVHPSRPSNSMQTIISRWQLTRSPFLSSRFFHRTRPIPQPQPIRSLRAHRSRWYSTEKSEFDAVREKAKEQTLSASQRFKELSRKYGWAAVGVYLGLSALDFPFCFLAVRMLGPDRVGEAEHYIVNGFWTIVGKVVPSMSPKAESAEPGDFDIAASDEAPAGAAGASIWTQLLLAYGVHKSLIFFRVPLTAAVTPRIVKYLRARGWKIGNPKAA